MKLFKSPASYRKWRSSCGGKVVLVPTMGALHHGHEMLLRKARRCAGKRGSVVASIFVNPTQFGAGEDFEAYPRPMGADLAACRRCGVDAVFAPSVGALYARDASVRIRESALGEHLCGPFRPGHFEGVCTVVGMLFLIVQPHAALFGEKDWQQLAILRRMTRDLHFPVDIIGVSTVREPDGLAASSRNAYLTSGERALAPRIHAAMKAGATKKSPDAAATLCRRLIEEIPGATIDYVKAVDAASLEPLASRSSEGRLVVAVRLGKARLIDNIPLPAIR